MSNLNNLTSKIIEDAKIKAENILKEARDEEVSIINEKKKEAENFKQSMIQKSELEAKTKTERILSGAELEVRNAKLKAKQEVIDKVFTLALEKLSNMEQTEFKNLVKNYILSSNVSGDEEIIVSDAYKSIISESIDEINKALIEKGKKGEITLSTENRSINSGFILTKNGIESNYTFESLVSFLKDELEYEIVKEIFN